MEPLAKCFSVRCTDVDFYVEYASRLVAHDVANKLRKAFPNSRVEEYFNGKTSFSESIRKCRSNQQCLNQPPNN